MQFLGFVRWEWPCNCCSHAILVRASFRLVILPKTAAAPGCCCCCCVVVVVVVVVICFEGMLIPAHTCETVEDVDNSGVAVAGFWLSHPYLSPLQLLFF